MTDKQLKVLSAIEAIQTDTHGGGASDDDINCELWIQFREEGWTVQGIAAVLGNLRKLGLVERSDEHNGPYSWGTWRSTQWTAQSS